MTHFLFKLYIDLFEIYKTIASEEVHYNIIITYNL